MSFIFEITDKTERKIHLSKERWRHILNHPRMDENQLENIKLTITKPLTIRYNEEDATVRYFYKYFRHMDVA